MIRRTQCTAWWQGYLPDNLFAPAPQSRFDGEWDERDIVPFCPLMAAHRHEIAAVILEPIVQGREASDVPIPSGSGGSARCDREGILLIADEIATGALAERVSCSPASTRWLSRRIFCARQSADWRHHRSLSATLTTRQVAETISDGEAGCFMHGPTFMGNPLIRAAATESLRLLESGEWQQQVAAIEAQLNAELAPARESAQVADVRALGSHWRSRRIGRSTWPLCSAFFVEQGGSARSGALST